MSLPENIWITDGYTWLRPVGEYTYLGLNDYLLNDYGEVYSVELPEAGEDLETDGHFLTVETEQGLVDIYSPVSGQIMEVNDEVYDNPDLINIDPFGPGWLVIISMDEEISSDEMNHWKEYTQMRLQ